MDTDKNSSQQRSPEPVEGPAAVRLELLGLGPEGLAQALKPLSDKPYQARQLMEWVYKQGVYDFGAMSNLGKVLRASLAERAKLSLLEPAQKQVSRRDGTAKLLFRLGDGELVESVWLPHEGRATACISTQVGCAMGCRFCATGASGFGRHLSPAEIVGQVLGLERSMGQELDNLVYMGMGEPFHNWEAVRESLECLMAPGGRAWPGRKITVSTCGVVPGIEALAASGLSARLAISLHAPDDETRGRIMPVNQRWPLAQLMEACRAYQVATGLQLTFEYALFEGVNDALPQARALARLLEGLECKLNLIPYNPVQGLGYGAPDPAKVFAFQTELKRQGYTVMLRTEKGGDIDAACGQLRRRALEAGV